MNNKILHPHVVLTIGFYISSHIFDDDDDEDVDDEDSYETYSSDTSDY